MTNDQTASRSPKTILVVDDDEMVRDLLCAILEKHYTLLVARNGVEAIELYARHSSQLQGVLTDWRMPQKNGSEVVAHIRQENPEIPILVMSGDLEESEAERLQCQEHVGFLRKPFSERELLAVMAGW